MPSVNVEPADCLRLISSFAQALRDGHYEGGMFYLSGERQVYDIYQGTVSIGTEHYVYKVSKVSKEILPVEVAKAITSTGIDIKRCVVEGKRFDATLWHDDLCYMLWQRQKRGERN